MYSAHTTTPPPKKSLFFFPTLLLSAGLFLFASYAHADITTGLQAHYQFENNTNDSTGNSNHGTSQGSPTYTTGQIGQAIDLNGTNQYVDIAGDVLGTGAATFSAWVYPRSVVGYPYLYSASEFPDTQFLLVEWNTSFEWTHNTGGSGTTPANSAFLNTWQHITVTRSASGQITFYKNGVQLGAANQAAGTPTGGSTSNRIGARVIGPSNYFPGLLDDVRIYSRALTQSDITELYNYTGTPIPDTTPPVLSNPQPTGSLPAGTTATTLQLTTNEQATCRYTTTPNTAYSAMPNTFITTGSTGHSTTLIGLSDGNTYAYYVRCIDSASNQNTIDFPITFSVSNPDTEAPTQPTSPSATPISQSQVDISWSPSTDNVGVTNYRIRRCQGTSCTPIITLTTIGNVTTYSDTVLAANTLYRYTISALDAAGNESGQSSITQVTTLAPDSTPPSTPTLNTPTVLSSSRINLSWTSATDPQSGIANYEVYRCTGTSCIPTTLIASPTTNSFNNTGLTPNITYRYRVRAVNGAGLPSSNYSNIQQATTPQTTANLCGVDGVNNSCTPSALQTLITSASDGDTIRIANGTHAWTVSVPVVISKRVTITGSGTCSDCGKTYTPTGSWPTTLTVGSGAGTNAFAFDVRGSGTLIPRLTGIHFSGTPSFSYQFSDTDTGAMFFKVRSTNIAGFRIDNNWFDSTTGDAGGYVNTNNGVIDTNYFKAGAIDGVFIFVQDFRADGNGDVAWAEATTWGGSGFLFIEDNTLARPSGTGFASAFVDAYTGGRYVFRHNYGLNSQNLNHDKSGGGDTRAGVAFEQYNNHWKWESGPGYQSIFYLRDGSLLLHNETLEGNWQAVVKFWNRRITDSQGNWGVCDGAKSWDGNNGPGGYACADQVGRGMSAGLGRLNTQPQAALPARIWNISGSVIGVCGGTSEHGGKVCNNNASTIIDGVDYCYSDDGACAQGGYTPYTYPHPFRAGGTSPPHCSDTLDNDSDGLTDYPADPGCTSASDDDETDSSSIVGDLNSDGSVNTLDWGIMNLQWFTSDPTADLNGDGLVNSIDFGIMNSNWG